MYTPDDLITGYVLVFGDDENFFASDPVEFDWPLQHMPYPEALRNGKEVN
jgi:hypothetical protein